MVDEPQTYADARNIQRALDALRPLVESGQATEEQAAIYERLQGQAPAAAQEVADTSSTYRGFQRGATLGLNDNIAGITNVVTRGGTYAEGQEAALERDRQARLNNPEAFNRGQFAGGGAAAGAALPLATVGGGSLATQMAISGFGGGGMGFAQGYGDWELDGSPPGEMWNYARAPTLIGAGTGVAAPVAGRVAGETTRLIRSLRNMETPSGFGRVPTMTLSRNWQQAADAGMPVDAGLSRLTDEAALVDVPGPMRATGQGLAAMRGEGGTVLERFVNDRAEGAGARIQADVDTHIGPANAAFNERRALATERTSTLGPQYDAALAASNRIEIGPTITQLQSAAAQAGPDTSALINRTLRHLEERMDEDGLVDAATLHWARSDLSGALRSPGPTQGNALALDALRQIDGILDTNVPGYAAARTDYANNRAMERAIEQGEQMLRGGRYTAMSPDEFRVAFERLSDAERDALRMGLRRDIDGLMGTARNDAAAAWGDFNRGWNQEKLRIALGDTVADDLIRRMRSEQVFSQTRGDLVAGSQTELRRGAREALDPQYAPPEQGARPGPIGRLRNTVNDAGNAVIDALLYGNRNANRNLQLGQMLSATGPDRDRIVQALIANALQQQRTQNLGRGLDRIVGALTAGAGGSAAATQN